MVDKFPVSVFTYIVVEEQNVKCDVVTDMGNIISKGWGRYALNASVLRKQAKIQYVLPSFPSMYPRIHHKAISKASVD